MLQVTACGPIDDTGEIKLKMEWSVPTRNIVNREIGGYFHEIIFQCWLLFDAVIPWNDTWSRKAKDEIWKKLGGPVFLVTDDQARDFPRFLGK